MYPPHKWGDAVWDAISHTSDANSRAHVVLHNARGAASGPMKLAMPKTILRGWFMTLRVKMCGLGTKDEDPCESSSSLRLRSYPLNHLSILCSFIRLCCPLSAGRASAGGSYSNDLAESKTTSHISLSEFWYPLCKIVGRSLTHHTHTHTHNQKI